MVKSIRRLTKYNPRLRRIIFGIWKYKNILLVLIIAVAIISGITFWTKWDENGYHKHYENHFLSAKTSIDKAIFSSDSSENLESGVGDINTVQVKISAEVNSYCQTHTYIEWQSLLSGFRDEVNDCERQKTYLKSLLIDLSEMVSYLKFEQSVASIISTASTKTNQSNSESKFGEIEDYWRQANSDVSKISGTEQNKEIKKLIEDQLSAIADSCRELSTANDAENRQQFDEARLSVGESYGQLAEVTKASEDKLNSLIADINAGYDKIF